MTATVHQFPLGPDRDGARTVHVPLQALRFHPRNIRSDLGDITDLAESIRHEGVLVPLMAERRPSGGLQLLHGHRRWAASQLAGLRRVPCVIVPPHADDEAMLLMLAENTGRAAVDPADLQATIRTLTGPEFGHRPATIAARIGVPVHTVLSWRDGRTPAAPKRPAGPSTPTRPRPPRIRAKDVHQLVAAWDAGEVESAVLVEQLRTWLGSWTPPAPELTS